MGGELKGYKHKHYKLITAQIRVLLLNSYCYVSLKLQLFTCYNSYLMLPYTVQNDDVCKILIKLLIHLFIHTVFETTNYQQVFYAF